jgi:hypothetical protein
MKNPPVAAKIHRFTSSTSEINIPKIKPRKHEQAERKFANSAFLTLMPAESNTAKSPIANVQNILFEPERYFWTNGFLRYCIMHNHTVVCIM